MKNIKIEKPLLQAVSAGHFHLVPERHLQIRPHVQHVSLNLAAKTLDVTLQEAPGAKVLNWLIDLTESHEDLTLFLLDPTIKEVQRLLFKKIQLKHHQMSLTSGWDDEIPTHEITLTYHELVREKNPSVPEKPDVQWPEDEDWQVHKEIALDPPRI